MLILSLLSEPMMLIAWVAAIVIVLSFHEFSHALVATWLGDNTAKMSGRLTLNPLSHISWTGFAMLMLIGFGWGKPVPFNPYNLRNQKYGPAMVAAAGPLSNLILAIILIVVFKLLLPGLNPLFIVYGMVELNLLAIFLSLTIFLNIILMLFNLIPIPPLDGSKILFAFMQGPKFDAIRQTLEHQGPMILILIIILDNFMNLNILGSVFFGVIGWVSRLLM